MISEEFAELREDIEEVKKLEFGRKIFEAFNNEYASHFANFNELQETVRRTETKLDNATTELRKKEEKLKKMEREIKMEQVLRPLNGKSREVMEAILKNVETNLLEEGYKTFVGRVVNENVVPKVGNSEKETSVLAESLKKQTKQSTLVTKTGDTDGQLNESVNSKMGLSSEEIKQLQKIAGIV